MFSDDMFVFLDKWYRQQARGIRSAQEVVDGALGLLAYRAQFELVEPVTLVLLKRFAGEVKRWVEYCEGDLQRSPHWMPYNDSRLVSEFYGGIAGGEFTPEQHSVFAQQMRFNVERIANRVRDLILEFESGS